MCPYGKQLIIQFVYFFPKFPVFRIECFNENSHFSGLAFVSSFLLLHFLADLQHTNLIPGEQRCVCLVCERFPN